MPRTAARSPNASSAAAPRSRRCASGRRVALPAFWSAPFVAPADPRRRSLNSTNIMACSHTTSSGCLLPAFRHEAPGLAPTSCSSQQAGDGLKCKDGREGCIRVQVLYVAHAGDSGAVMACTSYSLTFPLRLTADHKPNRCAPWLFTPTL